ncbi:O-antigen ligase family protein [Chryseobacterium soldanellicola]|uniref:O-antigen ligase family protein n=1 Tax=Chryseobacterium soldanellicola TaxID=311333 RepID=UPI00147B6A08|nr:O-antigen ligase family protein [Chryseobacterium soldanellicola]
MPVIALLSLDYQKVDFKQFCKIVLWFFLIILTINVLFIKKLGGNRSGIFRSYYILTGHYGLSSVLVGLFSYLFLKKKQKIYLLAIILGAIPMFFSAARSPVLALFVVFLVFLILKNEKKYWAYSLITVILSIILLFVIYKSGLGDNIVFFKRINEAIFERDASGRSYYLNKGIDIFINNPWLGGRVLFEDGMYPHNLFVDVLMSTGLVGMILFIIYFKFVAQSFIKVLKNNKKYKEGGILAFFFLQYFILAQTSGNIYSSFEFWYFGAAVIGLGYINLTNEEIKSSDSRGYTAGDH